MRRLRLLPEEELATNRHILWRTRRHDLPSQMQSHQPQQAPAPASPNVSHTAGTQRVHQPNVIPFQSPSTVSSVSFAMQRRTVSDGDMSRGEMEIVTFMRFLRKLWVAFEQTG